MNWLAMAMKLRDLSKIHGSDALKYRRAGGDTSDGNYIINETLAWVCQDLAVAIEHGALTPTKKEANNG